MNTYWIKLPPRTRALGVFFVTFVLAMRGFSITGGLEQVDWLFGIYIGGLVTYFLARWGTFAARVALILPGQKLTIYEFYIGIFYIEYFVLVSVFTYVEFVWRNTTKFKKE